MKNEKITHTKEETEYRYYDKSGDASLSVCHVFDGVDIIFNSVHMNFCDLAAETSGRLIEIHHCREGRLEHQHGDELLYMMPGDLSISLPPFSYLLYNFILSSAMPMISVK